MLAAHPYEEPAYDVVELAPTDEPARGQGRIGTLAAPMTLARVRRARRRRAPGHRTRRAGRGRPRPAGAHRRAVRGRGRLPARPGATHRRGRLPDLRPAPPPGERVPGARGAARRPALVDVAHWAAEWTWLPVLRRKLAAALGDTVEVHVSTTHDRSVDLPRGHRLRRHPESRPVRPAQAARRPGARLPSRRSRPPAADDAGDRAAAASNETRRKQLDDRARDLRVAVDDLTAEQKQGRRRRRAGEDPARARPQPDGRRA